ncbi:hypothetical protein B0H10DRAFT_2242623 [Mycena sp. CBHHK59/15]|nr:hypothetical protein B0H10DRAFT_2242623 [Mycena sp. CBHHK59/15]
MPRLSSRQARAHHILREYLRLHTARLKRRIRRKNKIKRILRRAGYTDEEQQLACAPPSVELSPPSLDLSITIDSASDSLSSSVDSGSEDSDSSSDTSSGDGWSDLLGTNWRGSQASESSEDSIFTSDSDSDSGDADDEMPELLPVGFPDSDDEEASSDSDSRSSTSSSTSSDSTSGQEEGGADQWDWDSMQADVDIETPRSNNPLRWVHESLEEMYAQRYEMPRNSFPRASGPPFMRHVLTDMKDTRADLFRGELRISPYTFDQLLDTISGDPVFTNDSRNGQMPIEDQLAITLFRFGQVIDIIKQP